MSWRLVIVRPQSTTTPGALYSVASGPDGAYRFDKLAPDNYKVSATVGMPMTGMKFYSKEVAVPSAGHRCKDPADQSRLVARGHVLVAEMRGLFAHGVDGPG